MRTCPSIRSMQYLMIMTGAFAIFLVALLQLLINTDITHAWPGSINQAEFLFVLKSHLKNLKSKQYILQKVSRLPTNCAKLKEYFAPIEQCLLMGALGEGVSLWLNFNFAVRWCLDFGATSAATRMRLIANDDDRKGFITVDESASKTSPCTIVTLGIGNDTLAEQQMLQLSPNCKFFGADPILEAGEIYLQIGVYDQSAVSAEGGLISASVLRKDTYTIENMTTISLLNYLRKYNISLIDNLLIDNEGPEYKLFPLFHRHGSLANAGITVCQLNVEVHEFPEDYGFPNDQYDQLISDFWHESPFWPLSSEESGHNRYYFVNVEDPECIRRYFPQYCT